MADEIDLENTEDMELEDDADACVNRLKDQAVCRRGRGFDRGSHGESSHLPYDSVEPDNLSGEPGAQRSVEGWILFITGVHEEAQEDDILERFGDFGEIKNINLNLDRRTGFLKGYCLVEYNKHKEAAAAREALNGAEILGQKISVDWCFVTGPKKSRKSGKKRRL